MYYALDRVIDRNVGGGELLTRSSLDYSQTKYAELKLIEGSLVILAFRLYLMLTDPSVYTIRRRSYPKISN